MVSQVCTVVAQICAVLIQLLANTRQVIALELQAHGRTSDRDADLSFEQDAEDEYVEELHKQIFL